MANPDYPVACPEGEWTKVATAVTQGTVWIKDGRATYLQTFRETGGAAPDPDQSEGVSVTIPGAPIGHPAPIDIYIWARGHDGAVRVDHD